MKKIYLFIILFLMGGYYVEQISKSPVLEALVKQPEVPQFVSPVSAQYVTVSERRDTEITLIDQYLEKKGSPLQGLGWAFYDYSRQYHIDYHLLVAVAGVESSFGVHYPKWTNNFMGWGSAKLVFADRSDCIKVVASKIATLPYYKRFRETHSVREFSLAYNRPYAYEKKIMYFINELKEAQFDL